MIIRKATLKDFEQMTKLYHQIDVLHSDNYPRMFQQVTPPARSKKYINSIINDNTKLLIVAEDENKIIGLAKSDIETSPDVALFVPRSWVNISTIVVDEAHHRKGVGEILLKSIYDWTRENNITEIELTVFTFNEQARLFYEKHGFKEVRKKLAKII